jgi:hypothetical protein
LCDDFLRLLLAVGEQEQGLRVGGELGEFALEVDAAHQCGVVPGQRFALALPAESP